MSEDKPKIEGPLTMTEVGAALKLRGMGWRGDYRIGPAVLGPSGDGSVAAGVVTFYLAPNKHDILAFTIIIATKRMEKRLGTKWYFINSEVEP